MLLVLKYTAAGGSGNRGDFQSLRNFCRFGKTDFVLFDSNYLESFLIYSWQAYSLGKN